MNIIQPADLLTEGVPEHELETASQLQPGRIVSGVGAQHAWMVLDAQAGDVAGWVRLRQLLRGVRSHAHQWLIRGEGARDCTTCGLRMQLVADLLPVTTPRARVVIPPPGVVNALDKFTVYAMTGGAVVVARRGLGISGHTREWSHQLPIIPRLCPIWSLPEALRDIRGDSGVVRESVDAETEE